MVNHAGVAHVVALLEEDAAAPAPKHPAQALLTMRDDGVVASISARLDRGQTVVGVEPLPYHAPSGLLFVRFDFHPSGTLQAGRDAVLVLLNGHSDVIAIVDPFDPRQPNPVQPSAAGTPTPSGTTNVEAEALPLALAPTVRHQGLPNP